MKLRIQTEQEEGDWWIAEVIELSGVMKYADTQDAAIAQAEALALRVLAECPRRLRSGSKLYPSGLPPYIL